MNFFLELFQFPFMQRAMIAGFILGILLACLGVITALRKMAFFGEGIAHASLAGVAIGVLAGFSPLPIAILWAIIVAISIFLIEQKTKLSSDTAIGIFFTASMALGVIMMNFTTGYQPELVSFLFGSILTITTPDLIIIAILSFIILAWFFTYLKQLIFLSLSEDQAFVAGIDTHKQLLIFYISLAIATVLGVKILGIVLISALLVLPPAISRLHTSSFKSYLTQSIIISEFIIIGGLITSYGLDLPPGAVIVLLGTLLFLLSLLTKKALN